MPRALLLQGVLQLGVAVGRRGEEQRANRVLAAVLADVERDG